VDICASRFEAWFSEFHFSWVWEYYMLKSLRFIIGGLLAGWMVLPLMAFGGPVLGVLDRPAMKVKEPAKSVLIDVAVTDNRLVAVGERGIIVYSDDAGETWQQAQVPVSVGLTAVCFPSPQNGWAVGHGGVVVHTKDRGQTWERQLEGTQAAEMAFENAKAEAGQVGPEDLDAQLMLDNATLMVKDGPDKPFLDLYFETDRKGIIVGSYGLIFKTEDGGLTWRCLMDSVENPEGLNLYAIHAAGDAIYLAGERGLFLISKDGGNSFQQVATPYPGTYFDIYAYASGELVLLGLQGNAYWSSDQGQTFNQSEVDAAVSFTNVTQYRQDSLLFANQAGMILESRDRGRTIKVIDVPRLAPVSSMAITPDANRDQHMVMTVGYGGASRVQLPVSEDGDKGGQP
jgi:photosystem II stability/assembly factor-like uncharacterized protein